MQRPPDISFPPSLSFACQCLHSLTNSPRETSQLTFRASLFFHANLKSASQFIEIDWNMVRCLTESSAFCLHHLIGTGPSSSGARCKEIRSTPPLFPDLNNFPGNIRGKGGPRVKPCRQKRLRRGRPFHFLN